MCQAPRKAGYPSEGSILSSSMSSRIRAIASFLAAFCLAFVFFATSAFAQTDGEGLLGETDDKMVTFISFGVLLFFVFVVVFGTIIQSSHERRGPAAVVTINRRERRNAVDGPTAEQLGQAFQSFEADDDARVFILTGA